jgi:enamine deaminase RidA (YjgF/YER057c/UK114 family)
MNPEARLAKLGLTLPAAAVPAFNYVPVAVWGNVAHVSGQLPKVENEVRVQGKVGAEVSVQEAQESARTCILQGLACLKEHLGSLDRIERILKVTGYVQSAPGFAEQPRVIDAASELLVQLFGEPGRHARSAVGVAELPRHSPVEIELVVGLKA